VNALIFQKDCAYSNLSFRAVVACRAVVERRWEESLIILSLMRNFFVYLIASKNGHVCDRAREAAQTVAARKEGVVNRIGESALVRH
jgi:hypothetical protein